MKKKETEKLIQHTKAEFLNEQIVKESDLETAQEQSYAKGWNDCNSRWIKTLRAELNESEDAISREDAIRIASINSMPVNECVRLIKELPSVTPSYNSIKTELKQQTKWIPVSERLPEDDKKVLVYVKRKDSKKSEMNGFHIARKHYMEGDPEGNSNFWGMPIAPCEWRIEGWSYFFEPEVLAWMPLPQPYKEGDSDEVDN